MNERGPFPNKPVRERINTAIERFRTLHNREPKWLLLGKKTAVQLGMELKSVLDHSVFIEAGDFYHGLRIEIYRSLDHAVTVGETMTAQG